MSRLGWTVAVAIAFAVVYVCSLTFVYVEGDDAASVAYHLEGRNREFQPPYQAYQFGADLILRPLPEREDILRVTAITISSVAAVCMMILMLALAFDWIEKPPGGWRWWTALLVLVSAPEFFYLGLVYHPTIIGMCFVLAAHLLLRKTLRENGGLSVSGSRGWFMVALSAVLMGFGVACRWHLVAYGLLIITDLIIGLKIRSADNGHRIGKRLVFGILWGIFAFLVWGFLLIASGYGIQQISRAATTQIREVAVGSLNSWIRIAASFQTLFTPAFVFAAVWGWTVLPRQRRWFATLSFFGILLFVYVLQWRVPKRMIVFVPPILMCVVAGFYDLLKGERSVQKRRLALAIAVLLALLPWLIGVQVRHGDTAWGPDFDVQDYDRPVSNGTDFALAFGAGAPYPSSEGPRPLFGHAFVLLGGEWREFIRSGNEEYKDALRTAIHNQMAFLVLQGSTAKVVVDLASMGLRTRDPKWTGKSPTLTEARRFTSQDGWKLLLLHLRPPLSDFVQDEKVIRDIAAVAGSQHVVVVGYPSSLRIIYKATPCAMTKLGPISAIVDLAELMKSASTRP